jgi:hypothetical protein
MGIEQLRKDNVYLCYFGMALLYSYLRARFLGCSCSSKPLYGGSGFVK